MSAEHYMNMVFVVVPLLQSNVMKFRDTEKNIFSKLAHNVIENLTAIFHDKDEVII